MDGRASACASFMITMFIFFSMANAETVVLTPEAGTSCFDSGFNQTANIIAGEISASIITFNCTNMTGLNVTIKAEEPELVYIVMQPSNITPDFVVELEKVLKHLDDDGFLDVPYSIITANTSSMALNFFRRDAADVKLQKIFISSYLDSCFPTSDSLSNLIPYNIYERGVQADTVDIVSNFTQNDLRAALFLCGDAVAYNRINMSDGQEVKTSGNNIWAGTSDIAIDNTTLFFMGSSSARVQGASSSPWAIALNESADHGSSFPVVAASDGAANFIGYHSTRWLGFEYWVNQFFIELANGTNLAEALQLMKNLMIFNQQVYNLSTLFEFMESNMVLFGKNNNLGGYAPRPYGYKVLFKRQINESVGLEEPIWFNSTIRISIPRIEKLVENSALTGSNSTIWILNISPLDGSKNTVNISFVGAVAGSIFPDRAAEEIVLASYTPIKEKPEIFTLEANNSFVNITSSDKSVTQMDMLHVTSNNDRLFFARLSSPNETKADVEFEINVTYYTRGITMVNETASSNNNKTAIDFVLHNPATLTVQNLTFIRQIPNASQMIEVSNNAQYRVFTNSTGKFVEINVSELAPGNNVVSLTYQSTLEKNDVIFDQRLYDRGDVVGFSVNLSFNYTDPVDIVTKIYDNARRPVWSNRTSSVVIDQSRVVEYTALTLNSSYPAGSNLLTIEVYDNLTGKPVGNFTTSFETTDRLQLVAGAENITFTHTNHSQTGETENWYFTTNDYVNLTGSVQDWSGNPVKANLTITLYLSTPQTKTVETDNNGGYADVQFSWSNAQVGSYILNVVAIDSFNNQVEYNKTIHITRFLNRTSIYFNITNSSSGDYIFNDEDRIYIIVEAYDENDKPVYDARIEIAHPQISSSGSVLSAKTDTSGRAVLVVVPESQDKVYDFNISAYSPLNTTKKLYDASLRAYVKDIARWKYNSYSGTIINSQSPIPAVRDKVVKLKGNLTITSGASGKISGGSLTYILKAGGSDVTSLSSCSKSFDSNTLSFEISCTPKSTDRHCLHMNATLKYDGVDIRENGILYCFDVVENQTGSTQAGGEQSNTLGQVCTVDDDCAAGEYCHNGVCTALSCAAGEVIYNHECTLPSKLYSLDVIPPDKIVVERGAEESYDFVVKNTGKEKQSGIEISLWSSQIKWGDWYKLRDSMIESLDVGRNVTLSITFMADENASIDAYPFTLKLVSREGGTIERSFIFYVAPNQADIRNLNRSYHDLEQELAALKKDVEKIFGKKSPTESRLINNKLKLAEEMLADIRNYMNEERYLEAYLKKNDLVALLDDIRVLLQAESEKSRSEKTRLVKYSLIIALLATIAFAFYYLWTLPPGYKPSKGYVYKPPSGRFSSLVEHLKQFKEKLKDINTRGTMPKYNFHRRKRWRHE